MRGPERLIPHSRFCIERLDSTNLGNTGWADSIPRADTGARVLCALFSNVISRASASLFPPGYLMACWRMLAHTHGQLLNSLKFGAALGVSHTTVRSYLNLLTQTFMVRTLEPLVANMKKRVVKSPKVFVRDSGILHALQEIPDERELLWATRSMAAPGRAMLSRILSPRSQTGSPTFIAQPMEKKSISCSRSHG